MNEHFGYPRAPKPFEPCIAIPEGLVTLTSSVLLPRASVGVIPAKTLNSEWEVVAGDNPDHRFNSRKKDNNVSILSYKRSFSLITFF